MYILSNVYVSVACLGWNRSYVCDTLKRLGQHGDDADLRG
jgi:hypothetical protein